jgi:hypothetical protein
VAEALAHPLTQQERSTIEEAVADLVPEQAFVAEEALVPEEAEP